jgi:hypothetical protein
VAVGAVQGGGDRRAQVAQLRLREVLQARPVMRGGRRILGTREEESTGTGIRASTKSREARAEDV